jgi:tryptophan synthase alpha chain
LSRLQTTLSNLKQKGQAALIPYITAGDPSPNMTVDLMNLLVAEGADVLELGVPFSDPMADGPVIQKAVERALKYNVSLNDVLEMVTEFRKTNTQTPIVLMGYLNPIEAKGYDVFAQAAKKAGVDGVLTVDMPPEETEGYLAALQSNGLDRIFLVAPTTPDNRLEEVNRQGSGFVYYVSLKGVTGSKDLDLEEVTTKVNHLKQKLGLPIGIGFGIRDGKTAQKMGQVGDAVIVGSSLVQLIEDNKDLEKNAIEKAISSKMQEFKKAMRS